MEFYKKQKAARALLEWKQDDLAKRSGVSLPGIRSIELANNNPTMTTQQKILSAFEQENVFFTQHGIEQREGAIRTLSSFTEVLEDAYNFSSAGDEILFHCASETRNTKEVTDMFAQMVKKKLKLRFTLAEGDSTITTPKENYRWISKEYFGNSQVSVMYKDRYIIHIPKEKKFIMIKNEHLTNDMKNKFEYAWKNGEKLNG